MRAGIADDAVEAANGVAIHRMIDRTIADAGFLHQAHDLFKRLQILRRIAVQLHIGNVSGVRQRMIGRFGANLLRGADAVIYRHMEAVGVIIAIGYAGNFAVLFAVDLHKASGKPLRRRGEQGHVHIQFLRGAIAQLAHVADDFQPKILRALALAVVFADQRLQAFRKADEAHGKRAVAQYGANLIVPAQLIAVQPDALSHQERIIAHQFARLNFKSIHQLIDHQRHHVIQQIEEYIDIVVRLDRQPGQIDRSKAQIAAPVGNFLFRIAVIRHHARAAAHVGDFRFGVPFLIIGQVERRVLKAEIREQALRAGFARQLEKIVIRFAGVVIDALLHAENLDREDRRFAAAQSGLRGKQQIADRHARFGRCIHAVIDGRKRHLCARAGIHGVQIVNQRFHRLIGGAIGFRFRLLLRERLNAIDISIRDAQRRKLFLFGGGVFGIVYQRGHEILFGFDLIEDRAHHLIRIFNAVQQLQTAAHVIAVILHEGQAHAVRHRVIEVYDALTAVLIVLVRLNRDARQRRVGANVLRRTQVAVTGGKAVFEQLDQIDLAAGGGQREEIHIVDMDIAAAMRFRVLRLQHEHQVELLRALGTVFQHRAHRGIAVDVRVFALDVGIDGGLVGNIIVDAHQPRVHFANAAALRAIENIALGGAHKSVFDQHAFNHILHLLHGGYADGFVPIQILYYLTGDFIRRNLRFCAVTGLKCPHDRGRNLFGIERHFAPVALDDCAQHRGFHLLNTLYCVLIQKSTQYMVIRQLYRSI